MGVMRPLPGESLEELYPDLASEWHPVKNGALTPSDVKPFSQKKVWWQCHEGHEWASTVGNRTQGRGCPVCCGKQVLVGFNDLKSLRPDLAAQWHPLRNGDLSPSQVTLGARIRVWWKCDVAPDHEWEASVFNRTMPESGTGCAVCAGRVVVGSTCLATLFPLVAREWHPSRNLVVTPLMVTPFVTKKVWWLCANGHEWQAAISSRTKGGSACPKCAGKVAITGETDLSTTHPKIANEWHPNKNGSLSASNVKAGTNRPVWWMCSKGHEWRSPPYNRALSNTGCPYCAGQLPILGVNDLGTTHPHLVREWHPSKNGKRRPEDVMAGTSSKVWWICRHGHEWSARVHSRCIGTSCPVCANKQVLAGFNDLLTTNPELATEWSYEKNKGIGPDGVLPFSGTKVWWTCSFGHEWVSTVANRSNGQGCPSCARFGFNPSRDGWLYFLEHPEWKMQQIGISNVIEERLNRHYKNGWELTQLRGPMEGSLTASLERSALRALAKKGAKLGRRGDVGQFDGFTESWPISSLRVSSLDEVINWIYEEDGEEFL